MALLKCKGFEIRASKCIDTISSEEVLRLPKGGFYFAGSQLSIHLHQATLIGRCISCLVKRFYPSPFCGNKLYFNSLY